LVAEVIMLRHAALALLIAMFAGCATGEVVGTQPDSPGQIAGTWQGYLMGQKGFFLITMVVRPDGAVNITGESFISATGKVAMVDGRLWLDATAGWSGPLVLVQHGDRRFLKIERSDKQYPGTLRFVSESVGSLTRDAPEDPVAKHMSRQIVHYIGPISCQHGTTRV
jgi:hypothetical protein